MVLEREHGLDWSFPESESYSQHRLKVTLFSLACSSGVEPVVDAALNMFSKYMSGDSSAIPALIRRSVFMAVARKGGVANYDMLFNIFRNTTNTEEKLTALGALGAFKEPDLIERTITYLLDGTVLKQDIFVPMGTLKTHSSGILALWNWMERDFEKIIETINPGSPVIKHVMSMCLGLHII